MSPHDVQDLARRVLEIEQDIAGVSVLGIRVDVYITFRAVAPAKKPYGGPKAVKDAPPLVIVFAPSQERLALSLLAYKLGNLWRRLELPKRIENWSLTSLQQRLVKTGERLVKPCALITGCCWRNDI